MRFVLISDTHMRHDDLVMPDGDVLIHAGDATLRGTVEEIASFGAWLSRQDQYRHKIFVAGNHDKLFQRNPALAVSLLPSSVTYLEDDGLYVGDLFVYGSPWQPTFGYDWAFNLNRGEPIAEKWAKIPEFTDVLITHGPPFGTGDQVALDRMAPESGYTRFVGCEDLLSRTRGLMGLKLHVFGHIHEGGGVYGHRVNASMLDERYQKLRAPIVFDI